MRGGPRSLSSGMAASCSSPPACLQQQLLNVLSMMMPLANCGLLSLAVGLVLTTGTGRGRMRTTLPHAGRLLMPAVSTHSG